MKALPRRKRLFPIGPRVGRRADEAGLAGAAGRPTGVVTNQPFELFSHGSLERRRIRVPNVRVDHPSR